MTDLAEALLEAHVRHELQRLTGERLEAGIRTGVAAVFEWLEDVPMNQVLRREQIHGVIERYVIDFRVSGGITELAGEMSNVVFSSASAKQTRIDEILSSRSYEDYADKLTGFEDALRSIVGYVARTAAFRALTARLIVHEVTRIFVPERQSSDYGSKGWIREGTQKQFPGLLGRVGAVIARLGNVLAERAGADAERRLRQSLDVEWLRLLADEVWGEIARRPIADMGLFISEQDLEDFIVLGYEVWSKFRKTAYFRAISFEVVDRLFQKYGEESLRSVIQDMGVTEEMMAHELVTFVRPVLDEASRSGFLESRIRARLEPFYRSAAVGDIIGAHAASSPMDQRTK